MKIVIDFWGERITCDDPAFEPPAIGDVLAVEGGAVPLRGWVGAVLPTADGYTVTVVQSPPPRPMVAA
jgi:hypothetical protein